MDTLRRRTTVFALAAAVGLSRTPKASQAAVLKQDHGDIAVGGVTGFESFSYPQHTARLRATGRARLYIHDYIWTRVGADIQSGVLKAFSETGPADLELPLAVKPAEWFSTYFQKEYVDLGVHADRAHVNGFGPSKVALWRDFADAAHHAGLRIVAPVMSPNGGQFRNGSFREPLWQYVRDAAQYGGGITTDAPPAFFLSQPKLYRDFVIDELRWANAAGLHSTFIVSPHTSGPRFLADTQEVVRILEAANAAPVSYVVENYDPKRSADWENQDGADNLQQSVAGVALWMAENAQTNSTQQR